MVKRDEKELEEKVKSGRREKGKRGDKLLGKGKNKPSVEGMRGGSKWSLEQWPTIVQEQMEERDCWEGKIREKQGRE